ncbi:hypothetical protein ACC786_32420 [Rhizobium ruizarguesonis]
MIKVQRQPADAAEEALERVARNGLTEREHALWHFSGVAPNKIPLPPQPTKAPVFSVYKSQPVKQALADLFGSRCAYCESPYAHVGPMEVEHFRPKGGYIDDSGRLTVPGYYWLAATFDNLLPSCVDCNRERKQSHRLKNGQRVMRKSGKANRFPVLPGTQRATCRADMDHERPLLLNPCTDQPAEHLLFLADGFVEPAATPQEAAAPRGRTTIDIYGLVRNALVTERRSWSMLMRAAMQKVLQADRNHRRYPADPEILSQRAIAEAELDFYLGAESKYHAMTRAMKDVFDLVRLVSNNYHVALSTWAEVKSPENRAALIACTRRVKQLLSDVNFDQPLVVNIFELAGVTRVSDS